MSWFPLPISPEDIILFGGDRALYSNHDLFILLHNSDAVEWQEKVGVAGDNDGSAKETTRLLCVMNCVFKTHTSLASENIQNIKEYIFERISLQKKIPVWVPDKTWFIIKQNSLYFPVSITPELKTIRKVANPLIKMDFWVQMLKITANTLKQYKVMLDLNPSNFGHVPNRPDKLFYIDDEIGFKTNIATLAFAIHQRIREKNEIPPENWYKFGESVNRIFSNAFDENSEFQQFITELKDPILSLHDKVEYHEFLKGFLSIEVQGKTNKPMETNVVAIIESKEVIKKNPKVDFPWKCFFSDVHANIYAFHSFLDDCKQFEIEEFIFLGDIVGYGPHPSECVDLLCSLPNIHVIQGNHDFYIAEQNVTPFDNKKLSLSLEFTLKNVSNTHIEFLKNMQHHFQNSPSERYIHGSILNENMRFGYIYELTFKDNLQKAKELGLERLWFGHSHIANVYLLNKHNYADKFGPFTTNLKNPLNVYLINPGSVGQPRDADSRGSYCLYQPETGKLIFRRFEYDIQKTANDIINAGLPTEYAHRLFKGI